MTEKIITMSNELDKIASFTYNFAVKVINRILEKKELPENKEKSIDELFEEVKLETNFEINL